MDTPQQKPKGPRRSARKTKNTTPTAQHTRNVVSDNELVQNQAQTSGAESSGPYAKGRRKPHVNKHYNEQTMSETNDAPMKTKATPIKQAYAGPTFHQSPAASALPIPSFYSKSVPNVSAVQPPKTIVEDGSENDTKEITPTKRESTPLDWIFDRARQAQSTPRDQSPSARSGNLSVQNGSPVRRSPAPRDPDSMFPFELDGSSTPGEDGTSFATPYKERMEALKAERSIPDGARNMEEHERKAKTEALKKLLLKSPPPTNGYGSDLNNPFNAKPAQTHTRSGPATPNAMNGYIGAGHQPQYFSNMPRQNFADVNHQTGYRQPSNLRNIYGPQNETEAAELSSDSHVSPPRISTARQLPQQMAFPSASVGQAHGAPISTATPKHQSKASKAELEDDLRRMLKLDVVSKG